MEARVPLGGDREEPRRDHRPKQELKNPLSGFEVNPSFDLILAAWFTPHLLLQSLGSLQAVIPLPPTPTPRALLCHLS